MALNIARATTKKKKHTAILFMTTNPTGTLLATSGIFVDDCPQAPPPPAYECISLLRRRRLENDRLSFSMGE